MATPTTDSGSGPTPLRAVRCLHQCLHVLLLQKPPRAVRARRRLCEKLQGRAGPPVSCSPHLSPAFLSLLQEELEPGRGNGEELTVALSRTFTESSSATLCFRRASSRVQRGRFSHFPNTTRSMSLDTEHTPAEGLKQQGCALGLTQTQACTCHTRASKTRPRPTEPQGVGGDCFGAEGDAGNFTSRLRLVISQE